jgi:type I restriction enzyme S subunit
MEKFATLVTGTSGSHQRVRSESLLDVSCVLPKKFIVDKFSNIVTLLFKYVAGNLVESDNLAHLRGILLPKLINGNLRVNGRLI